MISKDYAYFTDFGIDFEKIRPRTNRSQTYISKVSVIITIYKSNTLENNSFLEVKKLICK